MQAVRSLLQGLSGAPWEMEGMQWLIERTMDGCYPPEIVVLSGNSSEKGALLSRLTMLPVFPPQNELCDQMPIHLCLRHSREAQPCSMELQDLKTGSILKGPWEFPAGTGFQDMQSKIAELSAAEEPRFPVIFTDRAMILHVSSPYVPNLDLVDLPGLEQSSPELAMAGEELVAHYIQSRGPRSIFLAVVTASSNPTASRVMALLQRHGLQERSIGVLTMCDELPRHKHDALRSRLSDPQDRQAWPSRSSQGNDGDLWLRHGYVAIEIGPLEVGSPRDQGRQSE